MSQNSSPNKQSPVVAFLRRRWLALLILLVVLILVLANGNDVPLNLIVTTVSIPEWLIILVTFLLGAIAGWIAKTRRASRKN